MTAVRPLHQAESAGTLEALIRNYRANGPLQREFYVSPDIFALDMERIFGRWWLFAGHACTIPNPGDFFTYRIGSDPIIVSARRARRHQGVPQHLPPPRIAHLHQGIRSCQKADLPVSQLDLRSRREAAARYEARFRRRPRHALAPSGPCAQCRRADLHLARLRAAQLRRGLLGHLAKDQAPWHGAREGRAHDRLSRERQLEARLRKQPRVLPLPGQPQGIQPHRL